MKHRHDWTRTDTGYTCAQCAETCTACTSPTGPDQRPCERPTGTNLAICPHCLDDARGLVDDIMDGYRHLPEAIATIAGLHAIRYDTGGPRSVRDDGTVLGGDALALTAGGSTSTLPPIDPALASVEREHDPVPVLALLTSWEDAWRAQLGEPAPQATRLEATAAWLQAHHLWAAQSSDTWPDYLAELHQLRSRVTRITGQSRAPRREPVPCVHCGGTIVRDWGQDGLTDTYRCSGCGLEWPSGAHYWLTSREALAHVPETHPGALVTASQALLIWPGLQRDRVDQWVARGQLVATGQDGRGHATYLVADITAMLADTAA